MILTTAQIEAATCYWKNLFTIEELDCIINQCETYTTQSGVIGHGELNHDTRKSNIAWITRTSDTEWFFSKIENTVNKLNTKFFRFDIFTLESMQFTLYDEDGSHYTWHWDMRYATPLDDIAAYQQRKVTAVLQLSNPDEYEGGDLELNICGNTEVISKERGFMTVFPSFVLHRVTPVTKGVRRSLVAWFTGPDWR